MYMVVGKFFTMHNTEDKYLKREWTFLKKQYTFHQVMSNTEANGIIMLWIFYRDPG